jgi:MFS family permease
VIRRPANIRGYLPPVQRESLGPRFHKVWAASAISLVGDGLIMSAMPLLIASATTSAALISGLEVARGLPWLMFGLFGGVVADRLDRRRVMSVVDAGRCIAVGLLTIAVWQGDASVGLIWVVAFLLGSGEVFFDNSAQSILPSLVAADQIEKANARFFVTENVARDLAGPALGALLFARAASLPFALDSASFLAASLLVFTLTGTYRARARSRSPRAATKRARYQERSRRRAETPTIRADLREGWTFLKGHELLRSLLILGCTYNFLVVGAEAINVLFVLRVLHEPKAVFGLVLTGAAIGGISAGLSADRIIKKLGSGGTILTVFPLASIAGFAAGTTNNVVVFVVAMAAAIACGTLANIVIISLRQTLVPDALLGRVNSLFRVGFATAAPLGALVAGQLAGLISLRTPLLLMGAGCALVAAAAAPLVNNAAIERARDAASN